MQEVIVYFLVALAVAFLMKKYVFPQRKKRIAIQIVVVIKILTEN